MQYISVCWEIKECKSTLKITICLWGTEVLYGFMCYIHIWIILDIFTGILAIHNARLIDSSIDKTLLDPLFLWKNIVWNAFVISFIKMRLVINNHITTIIKIQARKTTVVYLYHVHISMVYFCNINYYSFRDVYIFVQPCKLNSD